jgi:hypothetical protein
MDPESTILYSMSWLLAPGSWLLGSPSLPAPCLSRDRAIGQEALRAAEADDPPLAPAARATFTFYIFPPTQGKGGPWPIRLGMPLLGFELSSVAYLQYCTYCPVRSRGKWDGFGHAKGACPSSRVGNPNDGSTEMASASSWTG